MFEGLTEFCFVFRFGFRASLLDFTSQIERLRVSYYCADVWSVLAHFYTEYSRARPSTGRSGQVIDSVCISQFSWRAWLISCSRSTVGVAAPARLRVVACCALVRNSLQTSCLQWDMTCFHNSLPLDVRSTSEGSPVRLIDSAPEDYLRRALQIYSSSSSSSRHNAGDRSMKVGHEISRFTRKLWFVNVNVFQRSYVKTAW